MNVLNLKRLLFKCVILGFGILIYSTIMSYVLFDFAYAIHSHIFNISKEHFTNSMYSFITFFKMLWLILFVIPYLALIWDERKG
tara:strand:- start:109 stop:360 length:252 start_codon:yes stop_codon:yes gene_type:complete